MQRGGLVRRLDADGLDQLASAAAVLLEREVAPAERGVLGHHAPVRALVERVRRQHPPCRAQRGTVLTELRMRIGQGGEHLTVAVGQGVAPLLGPIRITVLGKWLAVPESGCLLQFRDPAWPTGAGQGHRGRQLENVGIDAVARPKYEAIRPLVHGDRLWTEHGAAAGQADREATTPGRRVPIAPERLEKGILGHASASDEQEAHHASRHRPFPGLGLHLAAVAKQAKTT